MNPPELILAAGWTGCLLGVLAGSVIGLFFHQDEWQGGYGSWRRRMFRLGHIAFFGLGFLNILYGLTLKTVSFTVPHVTLAVWLLIVGAISMPLCCFLSGWRKPFHHFFPVPVISVAGGIVLLLVGWFGG